MSIATASMHSAASSDAVRMAQPFHTSVPGRCKVFAGRVDRSL